MSWGWQARVSYSSVWSVFQQLGAESRLHERLEKIFKASTWIVPRFT